jgi:hypothetical protein
MKYILTCDTCGVELTVTGSIEDGPPAMEHCSDPMHQVYTPPHIVCPPDTRQAVEKVLRGEGGEEIPGMTREQVAETIG